MSSFKIFDDSVPLHRARSRFLAFIPANSCSCAAQIVLVPCKINITACKAFDFPIVLHPSTGEFSSMAKIAKTAGRDKVMDTTKSTDCPKCGKPTRIVKRVKDRERNIPGGVYISCSACEFYEKL